MLVAGCWLLVEMREHGGDGAAAVVEGEAVGGGKFGHGAAEVGKEEEWVVAEAAGAARDGEDEALDRAFGGVEDFAIAGEGERAAVTGLAAGFGDGGECGEECGVVAIVWIFVGAGAGCGGDREGWLLVGGEAGAADAGCAVEGGDFEAGVVGEDEEVGGAEGVVDGFEAGVEFEGGFVLGRSGDGGEA